MKKILPLVVLGLATPLYGGFVLYENFEGGVPPTGWDTTYASRYVSWYQRTYSYPPGVEFGSYYAGVKVSSTYSSDTGNATLITPILDLSAMAGPETLSFYYRFSSDTSMGSDDTIYVELGPGGDFTSPVVLYTITADYPQPTTMTEVRIGLDAYDGTSVAIRFRYRNNDDGGVSGFNRYFWLDRVVVFNPSTNNPPEIFFVGHDPSNPDSNVYVNVAYVAFDSDGSIANVEVRYWYNSGSPSSVSAVMDTGSVYVAQIPPPDFYSKTKFYAVAYDDSGDSAIYPVRFFVHGFKTIGEARTLPDGDTVQVKGVLTANTFGKPEYIQDSTAGIAIYDYNFHDAFSMPSDLGYEVAVAGILYTYNNLREMVTLSAFDTLTYVGVPDPLVITIADVGEPYEGMLARIDNVQFLDTTGTFAGSTNYTVTDGVDNLTVRIDADTDIPGMEVPNEVLSIIGIVGQYNTTYQLLPRSREDFLMTAVAERPSKNRTSLFKVVSGGLELQTEASVYRADGRLIFTGSGRIRLKPGVYFVKSGSLLRKVLLR
ncbi:MAG: hypothetical protein GXO39_07910 [Thermotogae bacterium]|nr:hypothetical protein [Thermotogota bacterium]